MQNASVQVGPVGHAAWSPRRLVRDTVDAAYASLTRLVGRGVHMALPDGDSLHVAFMPADSDCGSDAILLEGPHGCLYLDAGVTFLLGLTGVDSSAFHAAAPAQRDWLEASLLGRLAGTPLGSMTRLLRGPVPLNDAALVSLHLSLRDGCHVIGTLAWADATCWHALLSAQPLQRCHLPQANYLGLTVAVNARLARHALAPDVLNTLCAGDVIVPTHPDVDVHGEGGLRCAHLMAQVRYGRAGTIEILSLGSVMENEHEASAVGQLQGAAPDLGGTPLQLEFRLGALSLTLGQLQTMAPGAILELEGAADGLVSILCGQQRLGQGEPVDVAGRLGIRITRWELPC